MKNNAEKDTESEVIYTRQELVWYIAKMHLDGLYRHSKLIRDKKFCGLLGQLDDYITSKLSPLGGGDITDTYVVLEQAAGNRRKA